MNTPIVNPYSPPNDRDDDKDAEETVKTANPQAKRAHTRWWEWLLAAGFIALLLFLASL